MRIPLSWVSLYTPLSTLKDKSNTKELAHIYSTHTAEIDGIEEYTLDKVVVGKVISCEKHPESKKLSIVRVDQGIHGEETILTGAANIIDARYVAVAMVGAVLPGDFAISERSMAGMISRGMICSDDELGLARDRAEGIMILEDIWDESTLESMLGQSFFDLELTFPGRDGTMGRYRIGDIVFEIDNKFITNRPDLFSVIGNAREFGAVFDLTFSAPVIAGGIETSLPVPRTEAIVTLETKIETKNCLSYHLLRMDGLAVGKSPFSISLMMERAGLSPKMDIVDITNLMMTEYGQPMHAFDAGKITGDITVRMAHDGEQIHALNGNTYTLTRDDMVIADEKGPIALAGVIGGMESAVSESTTAVIWESACFDATCVRLTAQRHGIRTDASTRYEKSLDPILAGTTFGRVLEYLSFLGKTPHITGHSEYLDATQVHHITIDIDYDFIDMKAGVVIPEKSVDTILERLGFSLERLDTSHANGKKGSIRVNVPSWRASKDIRVKEDIAEEVVRIYGYDHIPLRPLSGDFIIGRKNPDIDLRNTVLAHMKGDRWHEVYSYSFTSEPLDKKILLSDMDRAVKVINAYTEEYTHMRRSLAPRLLLAASENLKYSKQFGFFEIGKVYHTSLSTHPAKGDHPGTVPSYDTLLSQVPKQPFPETKMIGGVMVGSSIEGLRSTLEGLLTRTIGYVPPVHTGTHLTFLHPGISGKYMFGDTVLLSFGKIHPEVTENFDLPSDTLYFEVSFDLLSSLSLEKDIRFVPISKYQSIPRELNFVMSKTTPTGEVAHLLESLHPWVTRVTVDSVFEDGEKVGVGKKSVNFAFTLLSHESTISDDEALNVQNLVIEEMGKKGYQLRSI